MVCFVCGKQGHIATFCPETREKPKEPEIKSAYETPSWNRSKKSNDDDKPDSRPKDANTHVRAMSAQVTNITFTTTQAFRAMCTTTNQIDRIIEAGNIKRNVNPMIQHKEEFEGEFIADSEAQFHMTNEKHHFYSM